MKTQFDWKKRIVSLENLKAMCAHVSGMSHRYYVSKVTRSRVHVTYSNPNEYGSEQPMIAILPCFPSAFDGSENPCVVMDILRVVGDNWNGEGWQAFDAVMDAPTLFRSPDDLSWQSHRMIRDSGLDRRIGMDDTCVICDLPHSGYKAN